MYPPRWLVRLTVPLMVGAAVVANAAFAAADEALLAAAGTSRGMRFIADTSAFYRAMSLFRLGREAEARRIAAEAASRMKPPPADGTNPLAGGANADDLILWMAYKEAKALLRFDAAPASPSGPNGP